MPSTKKEKKVSYDIFISQLVKLANTKCNPYETAVFILRFADQIDENDPELALQLTAIAEGVFDDKS